MKGDAPMAISTQPLPPAASGDPGDGPGTTSDEHAHQVRVFKAHAAVFAGGMAVIFLVNLLTNLAAGIADEWWAWWSVWALLGWGIAVGVHGLVVWLARPNRNADDGTMT